jgi:hypothetical protein
MQRIIIIFFILGCEDSWKTEDSQVTPEVQEEEEEEEQQQDTATTDTDDEDTDPPDDPLDQDNDGDGYSENQGDCNDDSVLFSPGNNEIPYDGYDNDCNTNTRDDDLDQDGFANANDCDDDDSSLNPDADDDQCDGLDQNCNGVPDEDWFDSTNEPNDFWTIGDETSINYLGELAENDRIEFSNYLFPEGELDTFAFYCYDGWGWDFTFDVDLWNVPSTLDLDLWVDYYDCNGTYQGEIASASSNGPGTALSISYGGGFDSPTGCGDTGWYVVNIEGISGEDCSEPFTITITEN